MKTNEQTKYTAPVQGGTPATAKTATADYVAPEASVGAFDLTIASCSIRLTIRPGCC